jgi:hypothetical protein
MADFTRTKTWDPGTLGANLATFDHKVDRAITRLIDEEADYAQETMKVEAPWTETGMTNRWGRVSTGRARNGLWARAAKTATGRYGISMGYSNNTYYGKYLELAMQERFQIVIPTMLETADSLMKSLRHLFLELNESEAVAPVLVPGIDHHKHDYSSLAVSVTEHYITTTKGKIKQTAHRIKGKFVTAAGTFTPKNITKTTRKTRRG